MTAIGPSIPCPKCRSAMAHVAAIPHPVVPDMHRNTYVCYGCNQTRTYMLPAGDCAAGTK